MACVETDKLRASEAELQETARELDQLFETELIEEYFRLEHEGPVAYVPDRRAIADKFGDSPAFCRMLRLHSLDASTDDAEASAFASTMLGIRFGYWLATRARKSKASSLGRIESAQECGSKT